MVAVLLGSFTLRLRYPIEGDDSVRAITLALLGFVYVPVLFAGFLVTSADVARRSNVSNMRAEYLGQVDEGSDLAHVVVRTSAEGPGGEYSAVSVDTYVKRDGQWRLKLSSDFDATIQRYRAAYARYQQRAARREAAQQE